MTAQDGTAKRLSYKAGEADLKNGRAFVAVGALLSAMAAYAVIKHGLIDQGVSALLILGVLIVAAAMIVLIPVPAIFHGLRLLNGDSQFEADETGLTYQASGRTVKRPWADVGEIQAEGLSKFTLPRLLFPNDAERARLPAFHWRRLLRIEPYSIPFGSGDMAFKCRDELEAMRRRYTA